ncbi:Glyoxylate reductase/hydroxypyruvate reductase [Larimichthys crocea]|uniref:Glyoxylate reductase/hydroxypyruvate reductase n=1 Tax=Larimichthys crocea TaxID=215358 RepID=A0A6G0HS76_LARCR|nr:Glyoxylate reductase/hydroxypyruvate reductase [Larimichthys crocea]
MAMEDDKPWALISEVGEQGYLEEIIGIITECFQIICYKDFIQNPQLHGPKIQVLFVWYYPKPEPWLLSLLPSLKVVASGGVGIDHLDVPYINSLGVKVTNTPDVVTDATADMALGLLLASARKIVEGHQIAVNPKTTYIPQSLMGVEVAGSTMGIIGMGRIGCKIAQRGKGFDMKILYHNRNRRDHPLLSLPNVLITPHVGTNTYTTTRKMVQKMVENAVAAVKGQPVPNEVNQIDVTDGQQAMGSDLRGGEQDYFKRSHSHNETTFKSSVTKTSSNPPLHGPKIQAMFVWYYPKPEPWLLSLLPSLKVVANGGVGIDHLDVPYINSLGVKVTNTPDVVTDATADMALGLLLASGK